MATAKISSENSPPETAVSPVEAAPLVPATPPLSDTSDTPHVTLADLVQPIASSYVGFDPDIHAKNEDGTPSQREDGTYRKKRGRKPGLRVVSADGALIPLSIPKAAQKSSTQTPSVKPEVMARQFLTMGVGILATTIGEEWQMQSKEEGDMMVAATAAYIEAKGGVQMSPEVMLLLVYGGFVLQRLQVENTQSKLSRVFGKIGGLFRRNK